jgi:uncharacterized protein YlbG (UPF0298 family)
MTFEMTQRRGLIVHLRNVRQARQLRRFGIVAYISEKMKYAVVYMNDTEIAEKSPLIEKLGFVRSVEPSLWPDVDTTVGSDQETYELAVDINELSDEPADEEEL